MQQRVVELLPVLQQALQMQHQLHQLQGQQQHQVVACRRLCKQRWRTH
jgi:hypothetical protein